MKKIAIISIIILGIIILSIGLIILFNDSTQKTIKNKELKGEELIVLLKGARAHLTESEELKNNTFTDESMILFALDYIGVSDDYEKPNYQEFNTIVNKADIEAVVKYIFNTAIDYSKVTFEVRGEYINVPLYLPSTDAQIYKYKNTIYNEVEKTYTAYIDCLEPITTDYFEVVDEKVLEYNEEDVLETMLFKYKNVNGRKVLLAYKTESN